MKPTRKFIASLPVILVLLLACQVSGTATPAALTGTPATLATSGTQPFTYVSQENGVTVHYPNGWTTQPPAQGDQFLVAFVSPDQSIQSELFVSPLQPGDTAESVTGQMAGSSLQGLANITIVSDSALTRSGRQPVRPQWSGRGVAHLLSTILRAMTIG